MSDEKTSPQIKKARRANLFYSAQRAAWLLGKEPPNWIKHLTWKKMKRRDKQEWTELCNELVYNLKNIPKQQ